MSELFELFVAFAKIGVCTFGGGLAMLPMIKREVVEKHHWASEEEIADYYAIGQCTPGIIAVNTATFVGYKQKGVAGGIFATAGIIFPSLVIITFLAAFISNYSEMETVRHAFAGIQAVITVLVLYSAVDIIKKALRRKMQIFIFISTLMISLFTSLSPVVIVIAGCLSGLFAGKNTEVKAD